MDKAQPAKHNPKLTKSEANAMKDKHKTYVDDKGYYEKSDGEQVRKEKKVENIRDNTSDVDKLSRLFPNRAKAIKHQ